MYLYLRTTYSDTAGEKDINPCRTPITPPVPISDFNIKEPTLKEVEGVIRAARTSSASGPN